MNNSLSSQQGLVVDNLQYLGRVCLRGHDWNGTGKSLRYKSTRACCFCGNYTGKGQQIIPVEQRFWAKVDKRGGNECWEWIASKDSLGYGNIKNNNGENKAHRLSYVLHFGAIPDGLHVLHKCDNRSCVRPDHLFLGTHLENMADMTAKKRYKAHPGEKNGSSRLKESEVREIRRLYATGNYSTIELGEMFGITQSGCHLIVARKNWKHVD